MILISKNIDAFRIYEKVYLEDPILNEPLHKIFIKNYLNGTYDNNLNFWDIPNFNIGNLILVINHFEKYKIEIELDSECIQLLQQKSKKEEDFKNILISAHKAKSEPDPKILDDILKMLDLGFIRKLTKNQLVALNHLLVIKNGANFSVPGSGKTSIALAYYHILKNSKIVDHLFIIGPASIFEPWESEYFACFGKKASIARIAGNQKSVRKSLYMSIEKTEIFLNTYHTTAKDLLEIKKLLQQKDFLLILDESHYVKKPVGGTLSNTILELSSYAKRRLILTGTPMPNGLSDLWSQITFLWKDNLPLGNLNQYLNKISKKDDQQIYGIIKRRIDPYFFRITKSQLGLPNPNFYIKKYELSPLQSIIYKGVAARFLSELNITQKDKAIFRELRRARAIRLLQISSNPTLLKSNCEEFLIPPFEAKELDISDIINNYAKLEIPNKFKAVVKLAEELIASGNKVVIWSMFVHNLFMLKRLLINYNPVVIYGGIPYSNDEEIEISREVLIRKFKSDSNCRVLLANPAACAESISLHKVCHDAIYLDRSFNCAHFIQSLDRIHRLGLKKEDQINYYLILSQNTIDEIVEVRLNEKIANLNYILEGDLPGLLPGYWTNDLGAEEEIDYNAVDNHIRRLFNLNGSKTN